MKAFLVALSVAVSGLTLGVAPMDVEAKRLGGGRAAGMQRQAPRPPAQQPQTPPQQPANTAPQAGAAAPAAAGAAAAAGKRSWMGPIAGLAAGLGIAALLSHFGLGAGLANFLTVLLLAAAAFFAIRWLLRRFGGGAAQRQGGLQYAGAGAGPGAHRADPFGQTLQRQAPAAGGYSAGALSPAPVAGAGGGAGALDAASAALPAGFDAEGFQRIAKMLFIRMQAANDAGQVEDLRRFTTPELFASLRLDLQERGAAAQQTDVVQLDAQVLQAMQEQDQWVVSVRFHGLIREEADAPAAPFDENWHFVRPLDGSRDWAIAGITPTA